MVSVWLVAFVAVHPPIDGVGGVVSHDTHLVAHRLLVAHKLFNMTCHRRTGPLTAGVEILSVISATLPRLSSISSVISVSGADSCSWVWVEDDPSPHDDFLRRWAVKFAHHSGILDGKLGSHPLKLYHACVGSAGAVRFALYFAVIGSTTLHPFESNVIVYVFLAYIILIVVLPSHLIGSCITAPLSTNPLYS